MKTAAVIGGTGRLGAPVAKALKKQGYEVIIISRNETKARETLGEAFIYRQAELNDVDSLRSVLQDCNFIHLNLSGHDAKSYFDNHVTGTKNVLEALGDRKVDCISMISSASAHPEFNDRYDNRYKLEAENLLKASGQAYLAFLPSWFTLTLELFTQKERLVRIGPSTKPVHWITAEEYAEVVASSYADPDCRNQRISIYGPEGILISEAFARYAEQKNLKLSHMPIWLAKLFGRLSRDPELIDVADLMGHYDKTGEKSVPNTIRTKTGFSDWLSSQA